MNASDIVRSSLGTFITRVCMSVAELLGVLFIAVAVGASTLGVYSLFVAVVVVVSLCTDLGVDEAATKRISEGGDRDEFFTAALCIRLGLLVVVLLALFAARGELAAYIGNEAVVPFLFLVPVSFVLQRTVESGLHGEKKVARAGLLQVVFSVGKLVGWVALLALGYGLVGLLAGFWVGQVATAGVGIALLGLRLARPSVEQFRSLYRYMRYSWIGSVKETAWLWTDTLILGLFVAPLFVGVYELSWLISGVFFFIASAISATLFANVSELTVRDETDAIGELVERSLVYTGIIAIPGLVGCALLAERVLGTFGSEYVLGQEVLVVLLVARIAHSYAVVFGKVIAAFDRPDLMFRVNGTFIALNVVGNVVAITVFGWVGAAFATTLAMAVKTAHSYRYLSGLIDLSVPTRAIALEGIAALGMGLALYPVLRHAPSSLATTVGLAALGALIYAALTFVLVSEVRRNVQEFITA